jgi:uncharacterized protein (DUF427 family)
MSVRMRNLLTDQFDLLRYEPTDKWIRAHIDGTTVVDSKRARLVWEPKRIVPTYAVPADDIAGGLVAAAPSTTEAPAGVPLGDRQVYDPSIPFAAHTTDGESLLVQIAGTDRHVDAFRPTDADLADYVLLDFAAFDAWYEEDDLNVAHPRDPFHRVDIVHSSRAVRVELDGVVLAQSTSPYLVFEPPLPVRYYFALDDVRTEALQQSDLTTRCAYKGEATYFSVAGAQDLAWGYRDPSRDAAEITGRIAFFNERVDLFVDDELQERPITPWSRSDPSD